LSGLIAICLEMKLRLSRHVGVGLCLN
jgi:hypothetical protein